MAAAILQKEKDAAKKDGLKAANEDNLNVAVDMNPPHVPLPLVVSPPSAPNLTSLLTGRIGQEVGMQAADNGIATDKGSNTQEDEQVDDNVKSPKKKKSKKIKSTKEDKSTKRDRSGSSLKKSSFAFATKAVAATSSTKDYKLSGCSTRQGLNARARINTAPTSSTLEIYLKTFSWSTLLQLCTRSMSLGAPSLLAPSQK